MKKKIAIFWFRRDLRLDDNHALFKALSQNLPVLPIFIFDKNILQKFPLPDNKAVSFIYKSILALNDDLKAHNTAVSVFHDTAINVFELLL